MLQEMSFSSKMIFYRVSTELSLFRFSTYWNTRDLKPSVISSEWFIPHRLDINEDISFYFSSTAQDAAIILLLSYISSR